MAGAGPVGLTGALCLALEGVRVLVLEKRAALSGASLASTIHPPTLEILDDLGVLRSVMHLGYVAETIQYRTPDGVFATFDMRDLEAQTRFPFRLHLEQSRITPILVNRLSGMPNAQVLFGREVLDVAQTANGAVATVMSASGTEQVEAQYILAADGARSTVRERLGIAFDGADYPDKILRVMTRDDLDRLLPGIAPVTYLSNGARSVSFLRMPDLWRMILRVPEEVTDAEALDEDWILSRFRAVLPGCARLPTVIGKDVYSASRRVASRFRQGRVYLMGDAAHVTSTRGGMNMNCGIHDAVAIASSVSAALAGGNAAEIDAAADERRRIATEYLIPRTHRNVSGGHAWADTLRETARDREASVAYLRTAAMLDMLHRAPVHV